MTVTANSTATAEARRDELAGRLMAAALGALDMQAVYLGDRLGLYRSLAEEGPATPAELAERAGIHPRYAREWLEHQAVGAILDVDDTRRRSRRPPLLAAGWPRRGPPRSGEPLARRPGRAVRHGQRADDAGAARGVSDGRGRRLGRLRPRRRSRRRRP